MNPSAKQISDKAAEGKVTKARAKRRAPAATTPKTAKKPKAPNKPLRANIDETLTAAIITEQGGKENHRERIQECSFFCGQFGGRRSARQGAAAHLYR